MTAQYAVIALLGVDANGDSDERHVECDDLDNAMERIRELVQKRGRDWSAITLVHIEDYAKMIADATHEGPG